MDERTRLMFTLMPLGLALFGLFFVFMGARRLVRERAFAARAAQAPGTVVGFNTRVVGRSASDGASSGPLDFPVVRYAPLGGPEIEVESPVGSRPRVHREGQAVTVLYDPADPRRAQIRSGCLQYALPLGFIGIGGFLFLFGSVFGIGAWFLLHALP
jgi:hypothetical protein